MINIVSVSNKTCQHRVNNGGGLLRKIQRINNNIIQNTT